jgi:two-component system, sensor histidine kinase LadS
MKATVKKLFFSIYLCLGLQAGFAQHQNYVIPGSRIFYLTDESDTLSAATIFEENHRLNFIQGSDDKTLKVQQEGVDYWVKFSLKQQELGHELQTLEVVDSHIDYVEAFLKAGDSLIYYGEAGHSLNFHERSLKHKNFVYELPPVAYEQDSVTFLLHIRSSKPSPFYFKLRSLKYNFQYATTEYISLGLFYGILILLALYNLILFLSVKDKKYLYFVFYVLSCLITATYEDSLGFQYLWPDLPFINHVLEVINMPLYLLGLLLYATHFLEVNKVKRRIRLTLYASFGFYLLVYAFSYFVYSSGSWGFYTFMVPYTVLLGVSILKIRFQNYPAILFLAGYSLSLVGILQKVGIITSDSIFLVYSFNMGLVIQVLFFSLALAQNFRKVKEEKEQAQQRIIRQLKHNERIISEKVRERTLEVEQQKKIIEQKNNELELANTTLQHHAREIERMNQLLNKENEELQEDVVELTRARVMLREVNFEEFQKLFPDEDTCYHYLAELKWKNGFQCKKCENDRYSNGQGHYARRCSKCGYNESATAETIFHRLHFSILKAFYLVFLVYSNKGAITTQTLSETLQMRANTCWRYAKKVKERLKKHKSHADEDQDGWTWVIFD